MDAEQKQSKKIIEMQKLINKHSMDTKQKQLKKIIEIQKLINKFSTEHEGDPDVEDFVSKLDEKLFELQDSIVEN